jgi:predicted nucleotidyltransferase
MAQKDYEEFIELLNANNIKFLIIGAHAVAFHARPRATKDLDILHETGPESAAAILKVIQEFFGGHDIGITAGDLANPEMIVQLGVAPVRIDLMGNVTGIADFEAAWARRVKGKYGNVDAWYISLDDLIQNKQKANRDQDKADVKYLKRAQGAKTHVRREKTKK